MTFDMKTAYSQHLETLFPFIDHVYASWDNDSRELFKSHTNPPITCSKGCGYCCHMPMIPVTGGEAFLLLNRILAEGRLNLREAQETFLNYAKQYFEISKALKSLPFTDEQQKEFMKHSLACPLLIKTGSNQRGHCSVYHTRPLICDYYHSVEDPKLCAEKKPHGSYHDIMNRGVSAVEEIRTFERKKFGRSVLGHLPLLLACLTTEEGLKCFLTPQKEPWNETTDFIFYGDLLATIGYQITENDIKSLETAQNEINRT